MASLSPNPTCALELPEVPPHLLQHPARCPPPAAPSAGPCFQPESLSPVPASSLVEEGTGKGAHSVGHGGMSGLSWDLALGQVHRSRGVTGSHPEWAPSPCGPGPAACSLTPLPQVTGGLFSFHFLVHLIAVSIDPAEANVRLKKNYLEPMPTFDRSKHAHVIQKQYCHLCEVTVSSKAKHCSACNKCVSGFDHHCKWLNNCVGSRNYWYFFFSVASASAVLLCLIVTLLYIFIQFFIDPAELRTHPYYKSTQWLLSGPSQVLAHPSSRLWGKNLPSGGGASAWPAPSWVSSMAGQEGGSPPGTRRQGQGLRVLAAQRPCSRRVPSIGGGALCPVTLQVVWVGSRVG
ncbi:uncharacterized protein LOC123799108 isoform X1 [Ursus americanus]|uniref:uncharacterized protein LOC123799108 isoform X1 n=1 Tax=Ursus americanus TaxID=9643 RepID=UPI001E67C676|nr:uncharacterized protein LOC123799108 isoform X1 [Ursus americanus]